MNTCPDRNVFAIGWFSAFDPNKQSMSVGYLLKCLFYSNQKRHCQILEFMFVAKFHPEAVEIFLCIHRHFAF